jgi:hypothetical protein
MHTTAEAIQAYKLRRGESALLFSSVQIVFVQVVQPCSINLNFNLDLRLCITQTRGLACSFFAISRFIAEMVAAMGRGLLQESRKVTATMDYRKYDRILGYEWSQNSEWSQKYRRLSAALGRILLHWVAYGRK